MSKRQRKSGTQLHTNVKFVDQPEPCCGQGELFDKGPPQLLHPTEAEHFQPSQVRRRAIKWMDRNEKAVELFAKLALDAAARHQKIGAQMIAEVIRWKTTMETKSATKIPNEMVAYVSRRLMAMHPELGGVLTVQLVEDERKYGQIVLCPPLG